MKNMILILLYSLLVFILPASEDWGKSADRLTREEMQSVIEFLGHDLLEGRAPGTRGGDLAERYMLSLFKTLGLKPGAANGYMQPFTLKGFQTQSLTITTGTHILRFPDDIVGDWTEEVNHFEFEGDAVFLGFGIRTDIWPWDDYKTTDLKDKILIIRVNDPGMYLPNVFEGKTLTYFGRWRYKIEQAMKSGARGILMIHTDETAGYGWPVVKNSWAKENLYLESALQTNLKFRGWIREEVLQRILLDKGIKLEDLYRKSLKPAFKPTSLPIRLKFAGVSKYRDTHARNVIATIPGKTSKEIVISAHIDHLGIESNGKGDTVFNGAIDNGAAVAAMIATAKILQEHAADLHYSYTFLACHAEEQGLLGSEYFVANRDRSNIVANINFESSPVWEEAKSIFAVGARYSTLEEVIKESATRMGLSYTEFSLGNQGFFYRSDQFPFAQFGIPSVWLSAGEDFASGKKHIGEFFVGGNYHTVKDEFNPEWPLDSLRQTVKLAILVIQKLDQEHLIPTWKGRLTFPTGKTR